MGEVLFRRVDSPLGMITLAGDGEALTGLWFAGQKYDCATLPDGAHECAENDAFDAAMRWLDEYFAGGRPDFMPKLNPQGSEFRRQVWAELVKVPYGEATTYGRIAHDLGLSSAAARAVGGGAQSDLDYHTVPSRAGSGRFAHGLCGRAGAQAFFAGTGGNKVWEDLTCREACLEKKK